MLRNSSTGDGDLARIALMPTESPSSSASVKENAVEHQAELPWYAFDKAEFMRRVRPFRIMVDNAAQAPTQAWDASALDAFAASHPVEASSIRAHRMAGNVGLLTGVSGSLWCTWYTFRYSKSFVGAGLTAVASFLVGTAMGSHVGSTLVCDTSKHLDPVVANGRFYLWLKEQEDSRRQQAGVEATRPI